MRRIGSNVNVLHTMRMAVVKRKKIETRVGEDGPPCSASGQRKQCRWCGKQLAVTKPLSRETPITQ